MPAVELVRTIVDIRDDQIAKFTADVEKRVQLAIFRLGQETRDMARKLAPKDTGALRASIYVTRPGSRPQLEPGPSYARQSTIGYWRAINSAYRKQLSSTGVSRRKLHLMRESDYGTALNERTQTLSTFGKSAVGITETHIVLGGHKYRAQVTSEDTGIGFTNVPFQSIMPYGGSGRTSFFVSVGAAVFYAGYVEFGTPSRAGNKGIKAQPFLVPSIRWAQTQVVERMTVAINGD